MVPFIGSGFSAPSGILTGQDFTNFLTWTVYRCVATTADDNARHHDLRRNGWPEPPNQQEVEKARKWVWRNFVEICDDCGAQVRCKNSYADPKETDLLKTTLAADPDEADPEKMIVAAIVSKDAAARYEAVKKAEAKEALATDPVEKEAAAKEVAVAKDAVRAIGDDDSSPWRLLRPLTPAILSSDAAYREDIRTKDLLISQGRPQALRTPPLRQGQFISSLAYVQEAAIRSLHEWRGTLDFLSRLLVHNGELDSALSLDEQPSQAVIDSFNFVITHGKRPNLAHNMLCHLAGRARIHTILTTNFDPLIEDAFGDLGEKLTSIPVSLHGTLPSAATVAAQNCVVKLHGSLLETRADFSLDDPPPRGDLQRFFEYVRGRAPGTLAGSGHLPALLLVCGYSGSDLRCVQMIQYLLDADPNAKVLWVCYKPSSVDALQKTFASYELKAPAETDDELSGILDSRSTRVIVTTTNRCDLLLYDLYQRLTLSLTRGGHNYQFNPNVPPGLDESQSAKLKTPDDPHDAGGYMDDKEVDLEEPQKKLVCELLAHLLPKSGAVSAPRKILTADGDSGLLPPLRAVFHRMTAKEGRQGAWLWLGDHDSTMSLAHELFTVVALRLGRFQLDHAQFGPDDGDFLKRDPYSAWKKHLEELFEHWNFDPSSWFVVIDGRNGNAGSAGWAGDCWKEKGRPGELTDFLRALQDARNPFLDKRKGLTVLYAPCSTKRAEHLAERWEKSQPDNVASIRATVESLLQSSQRPPPAVANRLKDDYEQHRKLGEPPEDKREPEGEDLADPRLSGVLEVVKLQRQAEPKYFGRLRRAIDHWIAPPEFRLDPRTWDVDRASARQALYAACLFRQSRHFSAFLSEGVVPCPYRYNAVQHDNDLGRYRKVNGWLKHWKDHELIYEKTGGFVWMYRDLRLSIKYLLEHGVSPFEVWENCWLQNLIEKRARTHFWIADWYTRAFRATGHAEPLVEALYHYGRCIVNSPYARMGIHYDEADPGSRNSEKDDPYPITRYQRRYARRALFEIIKTLRIGRREIRFWMQSAAGETWFRLRIYAAGKPSDPGHVFSQFEETFKKLYADEPEKGLENWKAWLDQLKAELVQHPNVEDSHKIVFSQIRIPPAAEPMWERPFAFLRHPDPLKEPADWWKYLQGLVQDVGRVGSVPGLDWENRIAPPNDPGKKNILDWLIAELNQHLAAPSDPEEVAKEAARKLDSNFRQTAVYVSERFRREPAKLHVVIQLLLELAYATVLHAKRREYCDRQFEKPLQRDTKIQNLWVEACALCALALDLCLDLPPSLWDHDSRLRIFAGTLYGLCLGRLGRFFEAHRRLNEAHGWLSKTEAKLDPLEVAVIEIRRAEVHLLEAIRLKAILEKMIQPGTAEADIEHGPGKVAPFAALTGIVPDETLEQWRESYLPNAGRLKKYGEVHGELVRAQMAKLDDAWVALEPAERALSGKTHSSLWWGQLHTLRLRILAAHWWRRDVETSGWRDYRARMFRRHGDHLRGVEKLFWAARAAYRQDAYHMLRLIHHALGALMTAWLHMEARSGAQSPADPHRVLLKESLERLKFDEILGSDYDDFKGRMTDQHGGEDQGDFLRPFYHCVQVELSKCKLA